MEGGLSASLKVGAHHCEACGSKAPVTAMSHWEGETRRQLECACGERWLSIETRGKRLQPAGTGGNGLEPVGAGWSRLEPADQKPPPVVVQPPLLERRGVGGVLPSDQIPVRNSDPDPSLVVNPNRARERKRRSITRIEYPPDFESEWSATTRTGAKDKACDAWERLGRPAFGAAWKAWQGCHEWRQEWHNEPHVSTWLNDGRYKQEPPAPPTKATPPASRPLESFREREERIREERATEAALASLRPAERKPGGPSPREEWLQEQAKAGTG